MFFYSTYHNNDVAFFNSSAPMNWEPLPEDVEQMDCEALPQDPATMDWESLPEEPVPMDWRALSEEPVLMEWCKVDDSNNKDVQNLARLLQCCSLNKKCKRTDWVDCNDDDMEINDDNL